MARSLHVKHEEKLGTSPLLNTFLVLAVGWMMIGAFLASAADAAPGPAGDSAGAAGGCFGLSMGEGLSLGGCGDTEG